MRRRTPYDPEPIVGELLRFRVPSRKQGGVHTVDMMQFDGHGECSCEHFQFELRPKLRKGAYSCEALDCYHLRLVKWHLAMSVSETITREEKAKVKNYDRRNAWHNG
jgi:hypothetical protein